MKYETILAIKETEKATVVLATLEGHQGPVVVKRLKGGKADIYRLLCHARNSFFPEIYEIEEKDGELFVAEEHIAGVPLNEVLEKDMLSDGEKVSIVLQLCDAVAFLHGLNPPVIHRDIKPSNILVTKGGTIKLIDFDASRQYKKEQTSGDTRLLGTAEYAPPEQFGYAQTDVRSDIYSMGVVFREIRFKEKRLQRKWDKIVRKCTNFAPEHRYQNVGGLKRAAGRIERERKSLFLSACGCLITVLVLACAVISLQQEEDTVIPTGIPEKTEPSEAVTDTPVPTEIPEETEKTDAEEEALTQYLEQAEEELRQANRNISYYYQGTGACRFYSSMYETIIVEEVALEDLITGEIMVLESGEFFFENSVLCLSEKLMDRLDKRIFELVIEGTVNGTRENLHVVFKVCAGQKPSQIPYHLYGNELAYDYPNHEKLHMILRNDSNRKIVGLSIGRFIEAEEDLYRILEDGQIIEFSGELLQRYLGKSEVAFYIRLDDGTEEELRIVMP